MYQRVESRELRRSVVRIDTVDGMLCGTGFFVAPGYVLTCAHVVKDQPEVRVVADPVLCAHPVQGAVVARSAPKGAGALWPFPDLAVIRLDAALDHPCVLLAADDPLGAQQCQTWGYPPREYGWDPPGSPATFSFEGVEGDGYLRLKAGQAQPGLSGAPLLCPQRRAVVGVVSASRNIDTDLGGWASPVSALFHGGPGVPTELLTLGRRLRHLNRAAVLADRSAWHRVLPIEDAARALERPGAPFTRGPRSSPADLLRSDFAVVPYRFRDAELDALTAWCRAPEAMSVVQVAGRGGAGKTRFALEMAARMERDGWVSGLWRRDAPAALAQLPLPRFVVVDYVEAVGTQEFLALLEALRDSATDVAPVRVLLLTRTGAGPSADPLARLGEEAPAALRTILAAAGDSAAAAGPLTGEQRRTLYAQAVDAFSRAWHGRSTPVGRPDLDDARYGLPLEILFEAFDRVLRPDAGPADGDLPVDRVLRHEERYWAATAPPLPWLDAALRRRLVAAATLAGAADIRQAHALTALVVPREHGAQAARRPVVDWLAGLYEGPGHLTPLRPDRLGEALVTSVLRDDPDGALLTGVLGLPADGQVVHALDVLARLGTASHAVTASVARALAVHLPALARRAEQAGPAGQAVPPGSGDRSLLHALLRVVGADLLEQTVAAARSATADAALPDLAAAFLRLGDLARSYGRGQEAGRLYGQCAALGRELTAAHPESFGHHRDLGVVCNRLGDTARAAGDRNAAAAWYQQALDIAETLVRATPSSALHQRDLAVCYDRLGELARVDGQWSTAERLHRKALATARRLAASEPDDASVRRDLLIAYNRLGDLLADTARPGQAAEMYEKAVLIGHDLAHRAPAGAVHLRDVAVSYNRLGDLARAAGDRKRAAAQYGRSLRIREDLARAEPESATCRRDLGLCYARLADLAQEDDAGQEAARLYRKAWEAAYTLVRGEPGNATYQADLTAVRKRLAAHLRDLGDAGPCEPVGAAALQWPDLARIFLEAAGEAEGVDLRDDVQDVPFVELGYDSLALLQVAGQTGREYGVDLDDDALVDADTPRSLLGLINAAIGLSRKPPRTRERKAGRPVPLAAVRSWVLAWLTENLELSAAQIDLGDTLSACAGFDSIRALDLLDDIEIVYGVYVAFDAGWSDLTIRRFIADLHADVTRQQGT
ncbi:trypsin-like peptidase domain-containing protein [Streptomyces sp. NPDC006733]|uniref:trypsin-like peptidase domain-containing protein n=1 Tax=Streptomyces sp. NPDC006733 TaxID=3155460 RepID=UPI0033F08522